MATKRRSLLSFSLSVIPLLILPVAVYNVLALTVGGDGSTGLAPFVSWLDRPTATIPMISGVDWIITRGDAFVLASIIFLFMEILKSTSTGTSTIMNHATSMMLFVFCLIEFLLLDDFATTTFFLITTLALLDVLAGVVVTIVSARRDFGIGDGFA